jgi:Uma2 family endonuclease
VAVGAETGFRLSRNPDTVLGPDAAVVRPDRLPSPEVQSGYLELAAGVTLVWVVEPKARAVRVYASEGTERRLRADHDDVLEAQPVLPGFRLPLTELFETA